jgi:hypothetical protein
MGVRYILAYACTMLCIGQFIKTKYGLENFFISILRYCGDYPPEENMADEELKKKN